MHDSQRVGRHSNRVVLGVDRGKMAESINYGYQGAINKDKAYRKLLLRSAPFRALSAADTIRKSDSKRVRISLTEMAIVRLREGSMSRQSRRDHQHTVTEINHNRQNYDYYSHYRRHSRLTIQNERSLPRISDPERNVHAREQQQQQQLSLILSSSRTGRDGLSSGDRPSPSRDSVRHPDTPHQPSSGRRSVRTRDIVTPTSPLDGYELRGSSVALRKPSRSGSAAEGASNDHVDDQVAVVSPRSKKEPANGASSSGSCAQGQARVQGKHTSKMADSGKRTVTGNRARSLVPRLGTFPVRCTSTNFGYYGKCPETTTDLTYEIMIGPESDMDNGMRHPRDNRLYSKGQLGLTERNIMMLEKLRQEEDGHEANSQKQRHVSSRVLKWVKDRQLHIELPKADDNLTDDNLSASSDSLSVSSADQTPKHLNLSQDDDA